MLGGTMSDAKEQALADLYARSQDVRLLAPLRDGATQFVPGEGNANADILFIGEAPGATEDAKGRPFVGAAGDLLRGMIEVQLKMDPEQCWITNVVKYRPPENRTPTFVEIGASMACLETEISIVDPEFIVTLGATPLHALLPGLRITEVHGQWQVWEHQNRDVLPLYHPAYVLRFPEKINEMVVDMQQLKEQP